MSLSADNILDRIRLKSQVKKWRLLAIIAVTLFAFAVFARMGDVSSVSGSYIARVPVEGIILESRERDKKLAEIKDDKNIKAVIVYINSPGGTMVGGENIYNSLRAIAEKKPVVAVMGSVAASGGYMAAIAADHITAHAGTITGSVGVMMQSAEFSELSKKLGVNFLTFKSGEMKGAPSPFEQFSPKAGEIINHSIADSFSFFLGLVKERRPLTEKNIENISDGRIFTGRQAVEEKLVDSLGGEEAALKWLNDEKGIDKKLPVRDVKPEGKKAWMDQFTSMIIGRGTAAMSGYSGITAIWSPELL